MIRRSLFFILVAATLAAAQRGGGFHGAPSGGHFRGNGAPYAAGRGLSPLLYSGLYYDSLLDAGYPVASQPPLVLLQPTPATREVAAAPKDPLLIELQGDRYVRLSGDANGGVETIDRPVFTDQQEARKAVPALLVFRDGHQEEISGYTIVDGAIYASTGPAAEISSTRKIELASLDLTKTIESNQSRGIRFQLPTAKNVVIVGP